MYFADTADLENHLNDDWTVLLHNLKAREELLHQLLVYNHRVIRQRLMEDQLFTNDQILSHHARIDSASQANTTLDQQEGPLIEKYEATVSKEEGVAKLMQRVGARVLETFQLSLDQCKVLDEELEEKHARMKQSLVRLLNQKEGVDLQAIAKLVVSFSRGNLLVEVDRLRKIVQALESGELERLGQVYDFRARRASLQLIQKQKIAAEQNKHTSVGRQDRSPLRDEIKKQEKMRKAKQKVAVKLQGLYSMLDLSKQQLNEDICSGGREKSTRLYNEIFSRNRFNHMQILAFQAKKDEFLEKVRLFKEMMERESIRIAQNIAHKLAAKRRQRDADVESTEATPNNAQSQLFIEDAVQEEGPYTQRKVASNRYRIQSPKQRKEIKEFLSSFSSVVQAPQQNFSHFKFDTSGQQIYARTNRNRLPLPLINQSQNQTVQRATSLDQKVQINKSKIHRREQSSDKQKDKDKEGENQEAVYMVNNKEVSKEDRYFAHRARLAIKNVDIGEQPDQKRKVREVRKLDKFQPHPNQYTFYVRKSNQKFYQSKLNGLL